MVSLQLCENPAFKVRVRLSSMVQVSLLKAHIYLIQTMISGRQEISSDLAVDLLFTQRSPAKCLRMDPSSLGTPEVLSRSWKEVHPQDPGLTQRLPLDEDLLGR